MRSLSKKVGCGGRVNVTNALHGVFPVSDEPAESEWKDFSANFETAHPYENSKVINFDLSVPGAKKVRVVFDSVDTESGYDIISIKNGAGEEVESLSGAYPGYVSDYFEGETGKLVFTSDSSINKAGFKVSKLQAIY